MYILKIRYKGASFIYDVDRIDFSSSDVYARTCTSIEVIQQVTYLRNITSKVLNKTSRNRKTFFYKIIKL